MREPVQDSVSARTGLRLLTLGTRLTPATLLANLQRPIAPLCVLAFNETPPTLTRTTGRIVLATEAIGAPADQAPASNRWPATGPAG